MAKKPVFRHRLSQAQTGSYLFCLQVSSMTEYKLFFSKGHLSTRVIDVKKKVYVERPMLNAVFYKVFHLIFSLTVHFSSGQQMFCKHLNRFFFATPQLHWNI